MENLKKKTLTDRIIFIIMIVAIISGYVYYVLFFTPKDSLELYQAISFANDFEKMEKLMLEGYANNFKEEDFQFINSLENRANRISQFTLFEYEDKTFLIMTTPGTRRLKVLAVEELPKEIRDYFLGLAQ